MTAVTTGSSAVARTLLVVLLAIACEKKTPAPTGVEPRTTTRTENVLPSEELGGAVDRIRSERGLARLSRDHELDRLAASYASQLAGRRDDVQRFAEQVHGVLGPHAVAAVDTIDLRDATELSQLQGIGMDHWELYGAGAAPRAIGGMVAAIVYAKRNAWSGTREQRRKLRDGIASFHEAFKRLYGDDADPATGLYCLCHGGAVFVPSDGGCVL